jgi:hypothetical protein
LPAAGADVVVPTVDVVRGVVVVVGGGGRDGLIVAGDVVVVAGGVVVLAGDVVVVGAHVVGGTVVVGTGLCCGGTVVGVRSSSLSPVSALTPTAVNVTAAAATAPVAMPLRIRRRRARCRMWPYTSSRSSAGWVRAARSRSVARSIGSSNSSITTPPLR